MNRVLLFGLAVAAVVIPERIPTFHSIRAGD